MSWFRCEADGHERRRIHMRSLEIPLDRDTAIDDLRVFQDKVMAPGSRVKFPTAREFAERWGWPKTNVHRLMVDVVAWSDPSRLVQWQALWDKIGTEAGRIRDTSGTLDNVSTPNVDESRDRTGTEVGQDRDRSGHTRGDLPPSPPPSPPPSNEHRAVDELREVPIAPLPGPPRKPAPPDWARKLKPKGLTIDEFVQTVIAAGTEMKQAPPIVAKLGTFAGPIATLITQSGTTSDDLATFTDDLVRVIRAARESSDPTFARNIRAEGWAEGTDRHRDIATICKPDAWDNRRAAALNPKAPSLGGKHAHDAPVVVDAVPVDDAQLAADLAWHEAKQLEYAAADARRMEETRIRLENKQTRNVRVRP